MSGAAAFEFPSLFSTTIINVALSPAMAVRAAVFVILKSGRTEIKAVVEAERRLGVFDVAETFTEFTTSIDVEAGTFPVRTIVKFEVKRGPNVNAPVMSFVNPLVGQELASVPKTEQLHSPVPGEKRPEDNQRSEIVAVTVLGPLFPIVTVNVRF